MEEKVHLLVERRDALKRQLEGEDPVFGIMPAPVAAAGSGCSAGADIQQLQTQLATLRVQFTDKHPRVVSLQESIARLQAQCDAEMRAAGDRTKGSVASRTPVESVEANPVYQNLKIQFNSAEVDLAEARAQLASNQSAVVKLRRDVDKITEVEAQLKQLNRDYDVVQSRHQELLKRWEDLMAKERLDPVSDNALFRSIEPPFALAKPVGPQRSVLLAAVLVIALAAGLAVSFVMNQVRPVYFTRAGLRKASAFPVLGSISMILTSSDIARRRNGAIIWGAVCLALVLSCAIAIVFAVQASIWMQALTGAVAI
jgi:polysaccharide chain length determinant protein (PEP-CTERM system associated)